MKPGQHLIFWIALLFLAALTVGAGQVAEASGSLPPYPTPVPPAPVLLPSPRPSVATIDLQAPAGGGQWAGVQWQTPAGQWFDVAGWQGPVDMTGSQRWWVEPKDFGTGPFRWVVYTLGNPIACGISASFYLPRAATDSQSVLVSAAPSSSPSMAPSTASRWRFALAPELVYQGNAAACGQYAIAGQVFNRAGQPLNSYRLRLTYPNGDQETILSGGAPDYGPSGFGFLLGRRRSNRVYTLELLAPDAQTKLAAPVSIVFTGACDQNVAWAVFRETVP
jgi:hypothetical protein